MRIIRDIHESPPERDTILTIGSFDGLHLGHRELLRRIIHRAQQTQRLSAVLTFDPHPRAVLAATQNVACLLPLEEKITLLRTWGLDVLVVLRFTDELLHTSARGFMQILVQHLRVTELWVGWDFALGYRREGNVKTLQELGPELGYQVHVIEPVQAGEVVVSSTLIRHLISAGRVAEAAEMLGRYHQVRGRVVPDIERGREQDFPLVNLAVPNMYALPGSGVYAAYASVGHTRYLAIVNIAEQTTPDGQQRRVEVHLLDLNVDVLGEEMLVQFVERLRDVRHFSSSEILRTQIAQDLERTQEILT
jgi:riboflavin kinase/FMN adenylyltransferase